MLALRWLIALSIVAPLASQHVPETETLSSVPVAMTATEATNYLRPPSGADGFTCGICKTWQYVDIHMIDTWMEHKYTSNNAEHDDLPSSSEPLSEVLLATPFSSQYQTAFRLVDGDPDDDENYNYLGQTVRLCNAGEGCHGYYDYWTCYEAHYECGGAFHEEQVLSELSHGSIEHLENKLRIFIEQAKAEVVADEIRFHGCDGSVKAHVKLTAALRAAVLRIDSKRLIVRNHSA